MKGADSVTIERMLLEHETKPDTRKNQAIRDCLVFLINEDADTDESLSIEGKT